jgi:1-aminocyclopropane-1-carboxylate deaminase
MTRLLNLDFKAPIIDRIDCDLLDQHQVSLGVLRLDQIHPLINGNKWFKLKRNIEYARSNNLSRIVSFGGAYSNHIYSLAAAGKLFGFETVGFIRGELMLPLNPVLAFAQFQGMKLVALSRSEYKNKQNPDFIRSLHQQFSNSYILPEGGANDLALEGCAEIVRWLEWQTASKNRYIAVACGTGSTLAGLVKGVSDSLMAPVPELIGIAVLKGQGYLQQEVVRWLLGTTLIKPVNWSVIEQYHCGGYAKSSAELRAFLGEFAGMAPIPAEPVYTGKLFYGVFDMIKSGSIPPNSEVIAIHSGGVH